MGNYCDIKGCTKRAEYYFEWYGINQLGEIPIVWQERYVCSDKNHLIAGASDEELLEARSIIDVHTKEEVPGLLEQILKGFQLELKFPKEREL